MRPGRAAAGLALGLLVTVGAPSPAAAASVIEVGWWTSSPFASAPEGGVAVGAGPAGPTTVAAIRLDLGGGVTRAVIRLTEAGGFAQEVAAVQVCRGDDGWTAEAGGALTDAPADRCGTSPLLLDEAEGEWSADVTALVGGDARPTLMLLPAPAADPTGTLGLGWEVQFEAPALDADVVGGSDPPPASPGVTAPPPASAGTPASTPARPSRTRPSPAPASATTTTPTTMPAAGDDGGGAQAAARPFAAPGDDDVGRPWGRFGGFVLASILIGGVAGAGSWLVTTGPLSRLSVPFRRSSS